MRSVAQQFPYVASWIRDGWIEIGDTDYDDCFVRVRDIGGEIWSFRGVEISLDEALSLADKSIADWCREHVPDLVDMLDRCLANLQPFSIRSSPYQHKVYGGWRKE